MTSRIAILGGGIAGVTAAWQLAQLGATDVTLYEASARLGGTVETIHRDGFTIETGPDGWVTEKLWARELACDLGLEAELTPSLDAGRVTWLWQGGQLVAIPDGMRMMVPTDLAALDRSPLFSPTAKLAFAAEPARAADLRRNAPEHDESVAAFIRRHFGDEVLTKVGAPLLSGVFGGDVRSLSVRAVMPRFVALERQHGSLITALEALARTTTPQTIFTTLRTGTGTLTEAMAAQIPPAWIKLSTPVTSLSRGGEQWTITTSSSIDHADALLIATPAHITRSLLEPLSPRMAGLLSLDASSAIIAALAYPAPIDLPRGFGFLVPAGEPSRLLAATFVDQKYPARAPANSRLLRAFFGGANAAAVTALPDAEIAAIAHRELEAILGPLPQPLFQIVRRWPLSLPQYAVGHLDRMAELDLLTLDLPGLTLLGNAYRGVGLPDLIRDARAAARAHIS